MSGSDASDSPRNDSESDNEEKSPAEASLPKKTSKKREHENDPDARDEDRKVRRVDDSKGTENKTESKKTTGKRDDSASDEDRRNSRRRREKDTERDRSSRRGRERESDRDRDYDRGREKGRGRKGFEGGFERDPPANYERYWGAGPKRTSFRDRDREQRRNYNHDFDQVRENDRPRDRRRDYASEKVGPRYYGGKGEENKEDKRPGKEDDKASGESTSKEEGNKESGVSKPSEKKVVDMLTSRTGGAYIPPAKLRMMQAQITDKSSAAYQRIAWEALKKSIHGHINKVNTGNLATVIKELLKENLVRGCGLLCRSIIQAQAASPTFTRVFAALVAVINSRFPQIGELLVKRVVINFKRGFRRQDKASCISSAIFIAHLVNQSVAHELLALEILVLLVENPTSDSVEVAIAFLKEVVDKLLEVAKKGTMAIQDMLRNILHEGTLDKRVQYIIETMFQIIKVGGARKLNDEQKQKEDEELLNLVEEEDQITHIINLDDAVDPQNILDVFKEDVKYEENEAAYKKLLHDILGSDSESGEEGSGEDEESEEDDDSDDEEKKEKIIDNTETNLVALRRTIYLTIQSSLDFEECAHKLMRMQLKPGQEVEMCHMILDCCAEMRTYEKFFGLLAQRFCMINKLYIIPFQQIFIDSFATVHRLEINKLRNVAKFFAHLLHTDAISWEVLSTCRLTEEDSTSSSRIFIKILFQELSEYMGLPKLNARVKDATLQLAFEGLFPRDDPKNTRFAINFFTSIGLGGLTDELREHLKTQPRAPAVPLPIQNAVDETTSSSSSSDSSSSSESSSESSSSDSEDEKKAKKKKKTKQKMKKSKELEEEPEIMNPKLNRERDDEFGGRDKRGDWEQRANQEKGRRNFSERNEEMEKDQWTFERGGRMIRERKDPEKTDKRGPERIERRDVEKADRRESGRTERRDMERIERREMDREERKDHSRPEKRDFNRSERRESDRGYKRDTHKELRKEEDFEGRRGPRREQRLIKEEIGEVLDKERRKETDRDFGKERQRRGEREKHENGDRGRYREKERNVR